MRLRNFLNDVEADSLGGSRSVTLALRVKRLKHTGELVLGDALPLIRDRDQNSVLVILDFDLDDSVRAVAHMLNGVADEV